MSPITLAIINGQLDIAEATCSSTAPIRSSSRKSGVGPLWATVDARWPERTWYPPASITEEKTTHLELLQALLDQGADPNARLVRKPWYRTFHGDWADPVGATPFWLAAKANDVEAMRSAGRQGRQPEHHVGPRRHRAPGGRRLRPRAAGDQLQAQRAARGGALSRRGAQRRRQRPRQPGLHAAPRRGAHRQSRSRSRIWWRWAADVTARATNVFGGEGQADSDAGRDKGDTVADMANGPRAHNMQFPETVAFLEGLGSANSNNCRYATCVVPTLPTDKKQ